MKKGILALIVSSLILVGCGSSDPAPENPVSKNPEPSPAAQPMVPTPEAGAPAGDPNGIPPENQGGTAIKANELGPQ